MNTQNMTEDLELVDKIHRGDQDSLGQLYEKYYDRVLQYSFRRTFDKQVAYDLTANTFVKVAENINRFNPVHVNSVIGWIFKIANNEVLMYYRKPEKYKSSVFIGQDGEPEPIISNLDAEMIDTLELYKKLHTALSTLKPKEQTIIDLYYFENMSYKEISESTGMKQSAIGVTLHRAVQKLKGSLEPFVVDKESL